MTDSHPNPTYATGTIHPSTSQGNYIVTRYVSWAEVHVRYLSTGAASVISLCKPKKLVGVIQGKGYVGEGKYGSSKHRPIYSRWRNIISRCYNVNHTSYPTIGALGIVMSDNWLNFQNFAQFYVDQCTKAGIDPMKNNYKLVRKEGTMQYSDDTCHLAHPLDAPIPNPRSRNPKTYLFNYGSAKVTVKNLASFCRYYGLHEKSMRNLYRGIRKSAYMGFTRHEQ
ncbi:hypothetical protein RCJ22_15605 [Vibrio sp. FNV 38]|nr:hypothetical protein [Vibrio sp. FNV 38]